MNDPVEAANRQRVILEDLPDEHGRIQDVFPPAWAYFNPS